MKPMEYIKYKGMIKILEECNYDLTDVRLNFMRECDLKEGYDLSKYIADFKKLMVEQANQTKTTPRMQEFLEKLGVKNYDN